MKRPGRAGSIRGFSYFALFVFIAGVGLAVSGGYTIWKAKRLQSVGVTVEAIVLERQIVREGSKGSAKDVPKLLVEFKDASGKQHREFVAVSEETYKQVNPGERTVKITYDPDDLKSLTYGTGSEISHTTAIVVIVVGVIVVGAGLYFMFVS